MKFQINELYINKMSGDIWVIDFKIKKTELRTYLAKDPENKWAIFNLGHFRFSEGACCPLCKKDVNTYRRCSSESIKMVQKQLEKLIRIRFVTMGKPINFPLIYIDNDWKKPISDWEKGEYKEENRLYKKDA